MTYGMNPAGPGCHPDRRPVLRLLHCQRIWLAELGHRSSSLLLHGRGQLDRRRRHRRALR